MTLSTVRQKRMRNSGDSQCFGLRTLGMASDTGLSRHFRNRMRNYRRRTVERPVFLPHRQCISLLCDRNPIVHAEIRCRLFSYCELKVMKLGHLRITLRRFDGREHTVDTRETRWCRAGTYCLPHFRVVRSRNGTRFRFFEPALRRDTLAGDANSCIFFKWIHRRLESNEIADDCSECDQQCDEEDDP